jgi:endonuclease G, mitochondrial
MAIDEDAHRYVVGAEEVGIDTVWIISGCLFEDDMPVEFIANGVAAPQATFKAIAWYDDEEAFHARGYIVPQKASIRDPALYLTPIREIEYRTGLNFFPELDQAEQDRIETAEHHSIWHP